MTNPSVDWNEVITHSSVVGPRLLSTRETGCRRLRRQANPTTEVLIFFGGFIQVWRDPHPTPPSIELQNRGEPKA